jgi:hypothetical protein
MGYNIKFQIWVSVGDSPEQGAGFYCHLRLFNLLIDQIYQVSIFDILDGDAIIDSYRGLCGVCRLHYCQSSMWISVRLST